MNPAILTLLLACTPGDSDSALVDSGASSTTEPTGPWRQVAVAEYFACALDYEGRPHCWGDGSGAIIMGAGEDPVASVPDLVGQADIVSDVYKVCALDDDGVPTCWGNMTLGMDPQPTLDLTLSGGGVCILTPEHAVECGTSASDWPDDFLAIPASVLPEHEAVLYCMIGTDGAAYCATWTQDLLDPVPGPFDEIACASDQCCGIRTDGALQCGMYDEDWWNGYFDLAPEEDPGPWHGLTAYTGVFCALDSSDQAHCWGLSDTWTEALSSPPSTPFLQIDVGFYSACGVTHDGEIECWGRNDAGQQDVPEL